MVAPGREPGREGDSSSADGRRLTEIRSLVPADPFAGLFPAFSDDTKVLFVVEGPKAVAVRRKVSVRTLLRHFRLGGRSLVRVRKECRADVAATLLESGVPVGDVARAIGLSGPQALGRFVRSCFGRTATQLGAELRERARRVR